MRINLPLHPHHFAKPPTGGGPLAEIGGELVVIELQGELGWEGERANGVVGVLGLERPDRPTLHVGLHHLLHGKIAMLAKPYAVIRRAAAPSATGALEGDAEEEESDADNEEEISPKRTAARPTSGAGRADGTSGAGRAGASVSPLAAKRRLPTGAGAGARAGEEEEEEEAEDEEDPPLFPEAQVLTTPARSAAPSSPLSFHPSSARDYSSDLDPDSPVARFRDLPSSPPRMDDDENEVEDEDEVEAERRREEMKQRKEEERAAREREERHKARRRAARPERTRHYEVVGVVRKKIVFALRPEPLVQPTELPQ